MRTKDVLTGLIVLAVILGLFFWFRNSSKEKQNELSVPSTSTEEQIKKTFNGLTIPEDAQRAELKDVSGGDSVGIATRDMVLADLPDLPAGEYYRVWVDDVLVGTMRVAKGGFLFEGKIDGSKVSVRLGDKTLLEGSF